MALRFFGIWTLGSLPLAFFMPRVRANFFGRSWHVPSQAYVMPRWIIRLAIGALLGQIVGLLLYAVIWNLRVFWIAASDTLILVAFCAGAWRRLSQHPCTEFTMPLFRWPWRIRGR
jgi:hypothetical protein